MQSSHWSLVRERVTLLLCGMFGFNAWYYINAVQWQKLHSRSRFQFRLTKSTGKWGSSSGQASVSSPDFSFRAFRILPENTNTTDVVSVQRDSIPLHAGIHDKLNAFKADITNETNEELGTKRQPENFRGPCLQRARESKGV